jgi:hypothetical protein
MTIENHVFDIKSQQGISYKRNIESNGRYWVGAEVWKKVWGDLLPGAANVSDEPARLLDVGCAVHWWQCNDYKVMRCDLHSDRGKKGPTPFRKADLNKRWPYTNKRFKGVTAVDVIEHVESTWHFVREATRVSQDFVIITTPNVECRISRELFYRGQPLFAFSKVERDTHRHINPVFGWQLRQAAEANGWKVSRLEAVSAKWECEPRVWEEVKRHKFLASMLKGKTDRNRTALLTPIK